MEIGVFGPGLVVFSFGHVTGTGGLIGARHRCRLPVGVHGVFIDRTLGQRLSINKRKIIPQIHENIHEMNFHFSFIDAIGVKEVPRIDQ